VQAGPASSFATRAAPLQWRLLCPPAPRGALAAACVCEERAIESAAAVRCLLVQVLHAAKQKLKLEQLVVSKGKFKDIGQKTNTDDKLAEAELKDLLSFDPSKSALGKTENKVITDDELLMVLDRSGKKIVGKGFMHVEKTTSAFDSLAK
jgi:hypothetical protein